MSGPGAPRVLGAPGRGAGRCRAAWDIALSAVLLVVAYVGYWIGALFGFLQLSLLTPCPDGVCGTAQAGGVQFTAALVIFLLGVVGTAGTVALQVFRRRSWWAALATLVLSIGGWFAASAIAQAALAS
ncbi:hypothetical protein [Pseudolysinimonas sp.]|uniref:hypothetical protein n=1 Tax=Pseudolysinimonas sp. TaxID=2680009 RepID=UPI003F7D60EB